MTQPLTIIPDDIAAETVYEFIIWVTADGYADPFPSNTKKLVVGCPDTDLI